MMAWIHLTNSSFGRYRSLPAEPRWKFFKNPVLLVRLRQIQSFQHLINQLLAHHLSRMIQLMERYADLPMDFADASLVVLAENLGHGRILTVDRHDFRTYRWNERNPFENLMLS